METQKLWIGKGNSFQIILGCCGYPGIHLKFQGCIPQNVPWSSPPKKIPDQQSSKNQKKSGHDNGVWGQIKSSWWFQPLCKILVKLDHFPRQGWKWKIFETTTQTWCLGVQITSKAIWKTRVVLDWLVKNRNPYKLPSWPTTLISLSKSIFGDLGSMKLFSESVSDWTRANLPMKEGRQRKTIHFPFWSNFGLFSKTFAVRFRQKLNEWLFKMDGFQKLTPFKAI